MRLHRKAAQGNKLMIFSSIGTPFALAQTDAGTPNEDPAKSDSNCFTSSPHNDNPNKDSQLLLSNLQHYICELLIKNQQLRMALIDLKSRGPENNSGRHA